MSLYSTSPLTTRTSMRILFNAPGLFFSRSISAHPCFARSPNRNIFIALGPRPGISSAQAYESPLRTRSSAPIISLAPFLSAVVSLSLGPIPGLSCCTKSFRSAAVIRGFFISAIPPRTLLSSSSVKVANSASSELAPRAKSLCLRLAAVRLAKPCATSLRATVDQIIFAPNLPSWISPGTINK